MTIQLEIPDNTPSGKFWGPHQWAPSVQLSRVEQVVHNRLPKVDQPVSCTVRIQLVERLGWKRFMDVYYAHIDRSATSPSSSDLPSSPTRLAIKLIDLSLFSPAAEPTRTFVEETFADGWVVFTELASLQGTVIPYCGGMFGHASGNLYCAIYEDAGRWLTPEEKFMDSSIRYTAVQRINDSGVGFSISKWQSVCVDSDGRTKITEREDACTLTNITLEVLEQWKDYHKSEEEYEACTAEKHLAAVQAGAVELTEDFGLR